MLKDAHGHLSSLFTKQKQLKYTISSTCFIYRCWKIFSEKVKIVNVLDLMGQLVFSKDAWLLFKSHIAMYYIETEQTLLVKLIIDNNIFIY